MKIIFFDDEPFFLDRYKSIMTEYGFYSDCYFYSDSANIKRHLSRHKTPALYFLDLVVENTSVGFSLADYIRALSPDSMIVFITGYPELIHHNSHYKLLAANVICKTSNLLTEELRISIEYGLSHIGKTCLHYKMGHNELHTISIQQIVFAETLKRQNKISIICGNGSFVVRDTLQSLEQKVVAYPFLCRCHSSFLVNVKQIHGIDKRSKQIELINHDVCYYSKFRERELMERWSRFG